jgi:simple sugar transport system ATP-binding protein
MSVEVTEQPPASESDSDTPMLEIRNVTKTFGSVISLSDISTTVRAGKVTCVLGDNGAGKSTFIKILSGVHQPSRGELFMDGKPVLFHEPREALDVGIATVYQDLAMVPLMAIWRNFFLGSEPRKGFWPLKRFDKEKAKKITREEMHDMGIDIRDPDQPVGTLSGGERQCVAIARAVHFGARLLILDEPTSALGVKPSGVVLKYILQATSTGSRRHLHHTQPHHAYPVGDRFLLLKRGKSLGDFDKSEISLAELTGMMAGGAELEQLAHELEQEGDTETSAIGQEMVAEIGTTN